MRTSKISGFFERPPLEAKTQTLNCAQLVDDSFWMQSEDGKCDGEDDGDFGGDGEVVTMRMMPMAA